MWPFANHKLLPFPFVLFVVGCVFFFTHYTRNSCGNCSDELKLWPKSIDRYTLSCVPMNIQQNRTKQFQYNNNNYTHTVNCCRNQMVTFEVNTNKNWQRRWYYKRAQNKNNIYETKSNVAMSAFKVAYLWHVIAEITTNKTNFRFFSRSIFFVFGYGVFY